MLVLGITSALAAKGVLECKSHTWGRGVLPEAFFLFGMDFLAYLNWSFGFSYDLCTEINLVLDIISSVIIFIPVCIQVVTFVACLPLSAVFMFSSSRIKISCEVQGLWWIVCNKGKRHKYRQDGWWWVPVLKKGESPRVGSVYCHLV